MPQRAEGAGECLEAVSGELDFFCLPNCFELFGFDLLVDQDWRPWLLEVHPFHFAQASLLQDLTPNSSGTTPEAHSGCMFAFTAIHKSDGSARPQNILKSE